MIWFWVLLIVSCFWGYYDSGWYGVRTVVVAWMFLFVFLFIIIWMIAK
jgi:hypothetical protein